MAALALATTPPFTKLMSEGVHENKSILNSIDWRQIMFMTLWNVVIMCIVMFGGPKLYDLDYTNADMILNSYTEACPADPVEDLVACGGQDKARHFTIIFNTFVYLQMFNMINCRVVGEKDYNVFTRFFCNWIYVFSLLAIFFVQFFMGTPPFFWLFSTFDLNPR